MKYLLPFILLISIGASAQQLQRYDSFAATTTSASGIGNLIQAIPNATITVFNYPGVGVSCAGGGCTSATTYTSSSTTTACGAGVPLTRPTSTTCIGTADAQGNFGFWAVIGIYQYCVASTNFTTQCYNTSAGQLNCKSMEPTVKCVDSTNTQGWAGSDIGAWINSADSAIGSGQGELWVFSPSQTNATTQISVSDQHVIRLSGSIGINAPILIGKFGGFECPAANSNGSGTGSIVATQSMANMIRMRVQDGSLVTMYINGCIFNGGGFSFTRGVIDLTGVNDRGNIGFKSTIVIAAFTGTGPGIYVDDCPNGTCAANAGGGHTEIGSVWVNPANGGASTAPCATFTHSNTAGSTPLGPYHITSLECQMQGDTASQAVLIQNNCTATCGTNQWQFQSGFFAHQIEVDSSCAACDGIKVDGVMGMKVDNVYSFGGNATSNAVHVTNNANNLGIHINDIVNISAGLAYKDDILGTSAPSNVKQVREFTAGAQTTGTSLWNSFDERPYWGNLVGISTAPPGLGVGTQRYGCYASSTLFGISCNLNGGTDNAGFTTGGPFFIGSTGGSKPDIDVQGATGFTFRFINSGFNGISETVLLASGNAAGITGTGACATITTIVGAAAGSFKCTGTTGAATVTITPGQTSTNGWYCGVQDETTRANLLQQTAHNTTTCTLTATTVTQNDVFVFTAVQAF